jgi:hypothetical protein
MPFSKHSSVKFIVPSFLCLALAACAADKPEDVGTVGMAVTTAGPDGATYRLTPGTRLELFGSTGLPNYDVGLDGDSSVVTIPVSPGDYQASLFHENGYTTDWPLERTSGTSTGTVNGHLITAQPVALTVTSAQTTSLVLQFTVATAGTISFDRGDIGVSIDVSQQQATGFTASADGTGSVIGTPLFSGPFAAGLTALLPGAGTQGLQASVSGHLTGAWQEVGGAIDPDGVALSVCAPFQLDSASGSGHPGLVALIDEANHGEAPNFLFGNASICVIDNGTTGQVRLRFSREGTAETASFQNVLGTAATIFHVQMLGDLPTRAYNSDTGAFDVNALVGTSDLPMTLRLQVRDDADLITLWYNARIVGTETFSFATAP